MLLLLWLLLQKSCCLFTAITYVCICTNLNYAKYDFHGQQLLIHLYIFEVFAILHCTTFVVYLMMDDKLYSLSYYWISRSFSLQKNKIKIKQHQCVNEWKCECKCVHMCEINPIYTFALLLCLLQSCYRFHIKCTSNSIANL